jgi:hypothetical protein
VKGTLHGHALPNQAIVVTVLDRAAIKTKYGYIGNLIAVLAGVKVAYALRPEPDGNHQGRPCYTVIGDSYILGVMNGEAFKLPDRT